MDDIDAIRQLKARYFRLMDTKDWAGMRHVFADDVIVDSTQDATGQAISGADALRLVSAKPFKSGVVQLTYDRAQNA